MDDWEEIMARVQKGWMWRCNVDKDKVTGKDVHDVHNVHDVHKQDAGEHCEHCEGEFSKVNTLVSEELCHSPNL